MNGTCIYILFLFDFLYYILDLIKLQLQTSKTCEDHSHLKEDR